MFGKRPYKRFPGTWLPLAKDTLWLATDHMLYVVLWFITEEYKRFYFRDIQAVIIHRTKTWRNLNIGLAILAVVLVSAGGAADEGWQYFFYLVTAFVLLFFLTNLLLGPTCECFIQTAVQKVKLTPLTRVRKARKMLDNLAPLVKKAQTTDA